MDREIIIPIIVVFLIIAVLIFISSVNKKNNPQSQYDERQELIRKNAYKYAFMTVCFLALIYFLITTLAEVQLAEDGVSVFLIIMIGIAVFAIYSIFKDAFFGIGDTRGRLGRPSAYLVVVGIIIIGNGVGAVRMIQEDMLVKNGLLTHNVMNLTITALFLAIFLSILIKHVINAKRSREDME